MKKRPNILTYAGVLCLLLSGPALGNPIDTPPSTTNIRGLVVAYNSYAGKYVALPGVRVDLYDFDAATQQWRLLVTAYTDVNGYYFISNLIPKAYTLQINKKSNFEIIVQKPEDPQRPFQDIAPIRLS